MLERLSVENFTVFSKASFGFAAGLNVIVGENSTGKSHVLKLAYAVIAENNAQVRKNRQNPASEANGGLLKVDYVDKLMNVFRAESMASFVRAGKQPPFAGGASLFFADARFNCSFIHRKKFKEIATFEPLPPEQWEVTTAVFIPTRELLTIYPGFVSLYEGRYLPFEETYRDTCLLLGEPLLKKPMTDLLFVLEEAMGGKVLLESGRFYLVCDFGKVEMPMVAEGIRKLAMLAQLIAVGALQKGSYLFWDEPEANLNPRLVKVIARVILQLAKAGIQIFIATHSYFLLKELDILTMEQPIPTRYFSLLKGEDGVVVESGDSLDDLQTIVALDEELAQFDREQDAHHA